MHPSRASLMTGRLPMRHGLLRPPMYGQPGGLDGEITLAEQLSAVATPPGGRQVAHRGEHRVTTPEVGFDDFYGFSLCRTCTPNGAIRTSSPRSSTARNGRAGSRTFRSTSASCTPPGRRDRAGRRGHDPGALAAGRALDQLLDRLHPPDGAPEPDDRQPWFLYHAPAAPLRQLSHERFLGSSPAKHPYKDTIIELDDIVGRLVSELEATGRWTTRWCSSRPTTGRDGDVARRRLLAVPEREGLDVGGGQRVPAILTGPG